MKRKRPIENITPGREEMKHDDYTVGWICALAAEMAVARAMLDERHDSLTQDRRDHNNYILGSIGPHNIVIACLPEGVIGVTSAARVAEQMSWTFRALRFGLMVGIGGGVPSAENDIRLGDVVVSKPTDSTGGVIQYDYGKTVASGRFEPMGSLNRPPDVLLQAVSSLKAVHLMEEPMFPRYLSEMGLKYPRLRAASIAPSSHDDRLFEADYDHVVDEATCDRCDAERLVRRPARADQIPAVHYGLIASGNQVMKDGKTRERLHQELNVLCFEMEAAGLMDSFPCLVIRGICDYADTHKNKQWQGYAAASAAAYAKELLNTISGTRMVGIRTMQEVTTVAESHQDQYLVKLPRAAGAAFNSYERQHEASCLPGTRVELLRSVMEWADGASDQCIFWLRGMAGTGKSTIARTAAQAFADQRRLGASFFFSRGRGDLGHTRSFFSTIAVQMAKISLSFRRSICKTIVEQPDIAQQAMFEQWNKLILQPLREMEDQPLLLHPIIIVVDALDECDSQEDISLILRLFVSVKDLTPPRLRILVTSRPETSIRLGFRAMPQIIYQDLALHHVSQTVVERDIHLFLKHELNKIRARRGLHLEWPGEPRVKDLVDKADCLFIFAATVCRFIDAPHGVSPEKRLSQILQGHIANHLVTGNLDKTYMTILQSSITGEYSEDEQLEVVEQFRRVVGSIVVLFDALSVSGLGSLIFDSRSDSTTTILGTLDSLHSVLDIPENLTSPVRLLHPSFRDFLLDHQRCSDRQFWIDEKLTHYDIIQDCLKLMSKCLKKNICSLPLASCLASEIEDHEIARCLPPHLQYACLYWVDHLQRGGYDLGENGSVHIFLRKHFLHWLEALSIMNRTSEGLSVIVRLESMLTNGTALYTFVHDAKRFILSFRSILEKAPLQIYVSAIMFSPKQSKIKEQFLDQVPLWFKTLPQMEDKWGACLQALEGHSHMIRSVAFSPDGQLVASGGWDKTVRLWDTTTGESRGMLEGHSAGVESVVFSPDGQLVASASLDKTVRLWDTMTGELRRILEVEGPLDMARTVVFSRDMQLMVSESDGNAVQLWDLRTGELRGMLEGHLSSVTSLAFCPGGQLVASTSSDGTVRLWDTTTAELRGTLEGHSGWVGSVAFSPNGHLVASGSDDKTVRLWDVRKVELWATLEGHSGPVHKVAFSPDGQLLASRSSDFTVRLWDTWTGDPRGTHGDHLSNGVGSLVFSPNGQLLASGSSESSVRLWNTMTGELHDILEGHSDRVSSVVFSPDGQLIASGSHDGTVRLWDTTIGESRGRIEGHSNKISIVVFSPDGQLVASGSRDKTVRLWDSTTGELRSMLEGHSNSVNTVAFSPNGRLLASGSADDTVRLWDTTTGVSQRRLEGHSDSVTSVAFSPNGQLIASGSDDCTVRLWNTMTGESRCTLEGHSAEVSSMVFSPDGQLVASASPSPFDGTVRLWDTTTGDSRGILDRYSPLIVSVVFSPNGQLIASRSWDNTVRVWSVATRQQHVCLEARGDAHLAFSTDSAHLSVGVEQIDLSPSSPNQPYPEALPSKPGYGLDETRHWVLLGMKKVFWLPPDRRPDHYAVRGNTIVLANGSGRVTILVLEPDVDLRI